MRTIKKMSKTSCSTFQSGSGVCLQTPPASTMACSSIGTGEDQRGELESPPNGSSVADNDSSQWSSESDSDTMSPSTAGQLDVTDSDDAAAADCSVPPRGSQVAAVAETRSVPQKDEEIDPFSYRPPLTKWDYLKVCQTVFVSGVEIK